MAPKPEPHRLAFIVMILAMVATSLMITAWAAQHDWATPIPPNGNQLQASTFDFVLKGRTVSPSACSVTNGPPGKRPVFQSRRTAGILRPTPRKRRMVSMNLATGIGFDR
jgi:hypothetical protein